MKIVFMGTPSFAVPSLKKLIENNFEVVLVVTQPDKVQGRRQKVTYSKVKEFALENNLEVFQPEHIKNEYEVILNTKADLIVTAAYGQILPKELLDQMPAINVHGSLLPKYRGGAPIQYALFDGLKKTGVTIMDMAYKMDSGDIILQGEIDIDDEDNYGTLSNKLSHLGAELLIKVLKGNYKRIKQDEDEVTFAFTLKREDEFLDVYNNTSNQVINRLRGLMPEPGATININNINYKVYNIKKSDIIKQMAVGEVFINKQGLHIQTKNGKILILEIQAPGRKRLNIKDFLNGQKDIKNGDFVEREVK